MDKELKTERVPVMFSKSELELIDDWMFAKRIRSRAKAIRQMCQAQIIKDRNILEDGRVKKLMEGEDGE